MNAVSYISDQLSKRDKNGKTEDVEDKVAVQKREKIVRRRSKFTSYAWAVILFFPQWLIIKPTQLIWWIISLPLLLIEYGLKSRLQRKSTKRSTGTLQSISELEEDDLAGGDEIFLQRDAVKGSLAPAKYRRSRSGSRSSTVMLGTKRMGRFLFPKKLIPRSVLHAEKRKRLVVDLDETLIHSASRTTSHSNSAQGHMVEIRFAISGVSTLYYVHKRPHCDLFLSKVSKWYDLVVFTASMREYADPVIDWLEGSFSGRFSKRLYRNNCILRDGVGYIKDLSIVCGPTVTLGEVILVDNSPISYAMNVDNAIQVEGWISDPSDTDLLTLLPFLEALRYTTDVRDILALKNSEQAFLS
ncbi:Nem1-Spo7 phosphatase catalytic subunit NEM1 TDEL_0A03050 [Torulaspora delbrueckii]|uniref:FCP1 homology domain-containing protein n=1 Tax=Torulaspora delbrueckii TaxID=4950 RepID=G8ZLZ3_TORDE|nr:hypothetical protein TDEL_0A03050 [Torulaspora delbrueckii]CCE89637.1 hypothetical protein TDEL_0A03050 [Torulaspora delbrueckii]